VKERQFLGLTESKSFVRSPECNGVIERWLKTLNEQVLGLNPFESLAQAITIIMQFVADYNQYWILHRTNIQSPIQTKINYFNNQKKSA